MHLLHAPSSKREREQKVEEMVVVHDDGETEKEQKIEERNKDKQVLTSVHSSLHGMQWSVRS
jgi:hypothetical protein